MSTTTSSKKWVLPVVHHLDWATSYSQACLALSCGADGVFFISHNDCLAEELLKPALDTKEKFPDKSIGLNFLGKNALSAYELVQKAQLDMVWSDYPGVSSKGASLMASGISQKMREAAKGPLFFGSVAFKYQSEEPNPAQAVIEAHKLGMIPTTSGSATGVCADPQRIRQMAQALLEFRNSLKATTDQSDSQSLALASGLTTENVENYIDWVSHYLVATGISLDEHHFCPEKLQNFVSKVRALSQKTLG